jgi:hypothetical protein
MKKSSFVRRAAEEAPSTPSKALPRGCHVNVNNAAQLLTSLGLHEWDVLCGGGALVGGTYLVEQDENTRHWKSLVRYYAAEALACEQVCFDHHLA